MAREGGTNAQGLTSPPPIRSSRIDAAGAGWVGRGEWGCGRRGVRHKYRDARALPAALMQLGIIAGSVRPWARFDDVSSLACCAVGLALHDASADRAMAGEVGIVGANLEGALEANVDFFRDYVANGRQSGRGSLFVQTLPSSPASQASILFGLRGPQFHVTPAANRLSEVVDAAALSLLDGDADAMVVVGTHGREALAVVIAASAEHAEARPLEAAIAAAGLTGHWWR